MGLLTLGTPLDWQTTKENVELVHSKGVEQFIQIYNKYSARTDDSFKWGDEIEFSLVRFDHVNKRCYLLLKAEQILNELNDNKEAKFQPEYASYMVESTPSLPFENTLECFKYLEENMKTRRTLIQNKLEPNEYCMSLTNFPLLGCLNFTWPNYLALPNESVTKSLFWPDSAIFGGHPRFKTLSTNVPLRRGSKPAIYVPIFKDKFTQSPFKELNVPNDLRKDDMIYLDAVGFGMGCCCLQVTFQAESINEARSLYDQLAPITPILLALTAASPVWRGYLSDVDCRWNIIRLINLIYFQ
jgi:glutamate--cysteine ligase catalytic subunit